MRDRDSGESGGESRTSHGAWVMTVGTVAAPRFRVTPTAIALGLVLISFVLALNALAYGLRQWAIRRYGGSCPKASVFFARLRY